MLITGLDQRNVTSAQDVLQAKMMVAVLRMASSFPAYRRLLIDAAATVNRDGFLLTGEDVRVACENWSNVMGFRTDMCRAVVEEQRIAPPPEPEVTTETVN